MINPREFADSVLAAAKAYEDLTGHAPTSISMSREHAVDLGLHGEPEQWEDLGNGWRKRLPPSWEREQ